MAAGDIIKEKGLIIEEFTVKANEDIEKGELVYNDGNGILAAAAGKVPAFMALKDHDYSAETVHKVRCVVWGFVECQKIAAAGGGKKGQPVEVSATAGEVQLSDQTAFTDQVGILVADAADADTTAKILLGPR